ncbi:hypothetical protein BKA00_006515 [Actinomadura coerulea]|uniref:DUF2238 domain-containing protein n=1 Tax=Actinomadura coerulea TaxID=46159 RepID=A0A7X0L2D2_9ACTN|nr:hypothetical protein [Actinomadura coerulea]GGQ12581.1 hypothetical protein GCM10010187_31000 [Actinomadura coerulea]
MDTSRRWRPPALAAKAALAALLALAVAFPDWDRFADKAMGVRVAAYPAAVMVITLVWALRGRGRPFPWDVDLLVTAPFVVDVAGNAADLYDTVGWFDDACHFGNWALLSAAAGVALRRWAGLGSWTLALTCTGLGAVAAILWEFFEYGVFILDTPETVTIYRDTIGDLMLGLAGSAVAGLLLGLRSARPSGHRAAGPESARPDVRPVPADVRLVSVHEGLDVGKGDLFDEGRGAGDADAGQHVVRADLAAGGALGAERDAARGEDDAEKVVQGSGVGE